jgi:ribonucleoside-triphosphate reductase
MIRQIVKRDGRLKPFNKQKIVDAIISAMIYTIKLGKEGHPDIKIKEVDYNYANQIAEGIEKMQQEIVDIEYVQTIVENKLMASQYKDVAREYIKYRTQRTIDRHKNSEINKKISDILLCKNIQNSNANVDEYSFGGRKFESAGVLHKDFALNNLIRPSVSQAHKQNRIYIHDLDSYDVGMHNCLFCDLPQTLNNGFVTRNGDVRGANSISTAMQLVAVIFQCQSQVQFGGVGSVHLDFDLAPHVIKSFTKHYKVGLKYIARLTDEEITEQYGKYKIKVEDKRYKELNPAVWEYAYDMTNKEGLQSAQALYHNLNTLESRPGSQLPFTSINLGRDTSPEGRWINEWIFKASIDGIGKYNLTSIFPISIFQYKKGINDKPNTPNYTIKKLAIKSMTKRIYPNWANGDWSMNIEDPNNPDTFMATMGCRTMLGYDRFSNSYVKVGRGNVSPITINLPKLGILHDKNNLEAFWKELDEVLELAVIGLIDRFYHICSQSPKSAPFMYKNGTMMGYDKVIDKSVYEAMKHNTNAIGYIGIAEMCEALFGNNHAEDEKVHAFALSVVKYIHDYAKIASDKYNLNFSAYATPAENLCKTMMEKLKEEYGIIPNVTDREYLTNSHHVPVWQEVSIFDKLKIEAPFCKYPTGGCITYIELENSIINNEEAIEAIIDYAMDLDIPYLAFNFPIDSCLDCGYQGEFNDACPVCGSKNIQQLRRVTGYLTTDYRNFNKGKIAETLDRVKHSKYTNFTAEGITILNEPRRIIKDVC